MKFQRFNLYTYAISLKKPLRDLTKRSGVLIQAFCGSLSFWSEMAPLASFSRESLSQAQAQLISTIKTLVNQTINLELLRTLKLYPSVFFALASCILQKKNTKSTLAIPLCRLIYGTNNEMQLLLRKNKAKTIKIKLSSLPVDESISLIRSILRKNQTLRLDINKKWTLDEALYFSKHFSKSDFEYLEEPCRNFSDTYEFSKRTLFPIAIDESLSEIPLSTLKDIPSLKAIIYKPMILGDWKYLLEDIPEDVDLIFSSSFESGVGIFSIAHLADFLNRLEKPAGLDTYHMLETDLLNKPFQSTDGALHLSIPNVNKEKLCPLISVS